MRLSLGDDWPVAGVIAAAIMMAAPLWLAELPAMPDYPAHLASFYLIAGGAHDSILRHFYSVEWGAIPNLAFEMIVQLLSPFVSIWFTTKLLLTVAVVLWVVSPALIHRALCGQVGLAPLGAVFFAYNDNFMWGFFNYYFAAGLALLAFAGWIASASWPRLLRILAFMAATVVIYFCHVFAAALLLFLIGFYELSKFVERRAFNSRALFDALWPLALIALPSFILFVFFKPSGVSDPVAFNLADSFRDRFEAAIAVAYDQPGYIALGLLLLFLALGFWRRWISVHRDMLILLVALSALTLLMPEEAMGGWGVDLRLPAILGALTFASLSIPLPETARRLLAVAVMIAVGFNAAALAGNWRYYDKQYDEFRVALKDVPRGSHLVTVLDGDAIGEAADQPYWHMAEYAVIDRSAFTPLLFTTKGQHVVRLRPGLEKIAATAARQGSPPDISELDDLAAGTPDGDTDIVQVFPYLMRFQCHYDEAVVIHLNGNRSPVPDVLHLRHAGSFFALYDIDHDNCPGR